VRAGHLTRRFAGSLRRRPPAADDLAWVESVLGPDAFALWCRQPSYDQRHSLAVARGVQAELAGSALADDPRWCACALLHDIGKLDARLGVYGRVVATLAGAVAGHEMADAWSERGGYTRRVGLYLRHAELGADRIRLAGAPEEAARWAAAHHASPPPDDLGIPERVVTALAACDDD
jgi:putative nucleotidyltransferase with HDIG domain